MSNGFAIGAVTGVLKNLLDSRFADPEISNGLGGTPDVTVLSPDLPAVSNLETEGDRLNLFMYQVTPNLGWRNANLPSYDSQGGRVSNPLLAIDLHYLMSAYSQTPFHAEVLLGYGMQLLHEFSVLPRDLIQQILEIEPPNPGALQTNPTALRIALRLSGVANQIEQIKITPESLSTEEISKLWSAFQTNYRPTAAYHVSVVLIERQLPTRKALPVRDRRLIAMPLKRPMIDAVTPQIIEPEETLTIQGRNFKAEIIEVRFGAETLIPLDATNVTDAQIQVPLPTGLQAGVNTVQVVHSLDFGTDSEPHRGFESNVFPFIVAPVITTLQPISVARGNDLTLSVLQPVTQKQRVVLLLGERAISRQPPPLEEPESTTDVIFPIPADFDTGSFLARVQVNGAESLLEVDEDENSPTFNQYISPIITVT